MRKAFPARRASEEVVFDMAAKRDGEESQSDEEEDVLAVGEVEVGRERMWCRGRTAEEDEDKTRRGGGAVEGFSKASLSEAALALRSIRKGSPMARDVPIAYQGW
jgi:hypothetical protein